MTKRNKALEQVISLKEKYLTTLERVQQDINWMLNSRQFLNTEVFDYIENAINEITEHKVD